MAVDNRLMQIVKILSNADAPVNGASLSKELGVSRQIIVGDITRLREKEYDIISTPKGYVLNNACEISKVFKVYHEPDKTEEELNLIVDLGAYVKDVFIYHKVYGEIHAKLGIRSRLDVSRFCDDIKNGRSNLLTTATNGYHYHTVTAGDEETMELVEKKLKEAGFLAKLTDFEPESIAK